MEDKAELFTFHDITKGLRQQMIAVTYQVPMVSIKKYARYALISVPTEKFLALKLPNGAFIGQMGRNT